MSAAFMAAVDARSADALRASLAPTFAGKANGRPLDGEAQVRLIESFWAGFPDGVFTWDATGGHGHQVITWTFAGTHGGAYLGVPASGTAVTLSGYIVGRSDKTGVLSLDWKWDTKAFTRQILGPEDLEDAMPKPAGHRPDPSIRWAREAQRRGGGRKPKRKGTQPPGPASTDAAGKPNPQRQRQPRKPKPADTAAETAAPTQTDSPAAPPSEGATPPVEPQPDGT
ncbi:MAG: ester cyclase [Candidatus Thermoplasmatota archaeon]|jgi:hypothetical protein